MVEWLQYNGGDQYLSGNPDKDLMDLLVEKTRTAGHMLTFREASSDIGMFRGYHYSAHFLSFEKAAAIAWQTVQQEATMERNSDSDTDTPVTKFMPQQFTRKELFSTNASINLPEESISTRGGMKMPKGRRYDNSEARAMLLNFYNAHGRFPRIPEAKEANGLPSWGVLTNALGPRNSWNRLIESVEEEITATDDANDVSDVDGTTDTEESNTVESGLTPEPVLESIPEPEVVASPDPAIEPEAALVEEKSSTEARIGDVEIDTSCNQKDDDSVTIDLKITVPGREKPILITLTV